jgi:hypothetical protein
MTGQNNGSIGLNLTSRGSIQDAAGNPLATGSFTGQTYTFDTTPPPAPSITAHPANPTNQTSASLSFTDMETGVSFVCKLDGGGYSACASPKSYSGLSQGSHSFSVLAKDAAGNLSASAASFTWVIDTTPPPAPKITQHPTDPTSSSSATFAFTDAEAGVSFECKLDSGAWTACASPTSYSGLGAAEHNFYVRAVDPAGNRSQAAQFEFDVTQQSGQPFTISGNVSGSLAPGVSKPLPLTISNPNSVPIYVTSLAVAVQPGSTKAGCDGPTNLQLTQSGLSGTNALTVPANGQVTLPSGAVSAPQVLMRNLATNQDACKGATFSFSYSGGAHS